ncbi:MAG: ferredoxin [Acidimicrobiales bacterium]|jgi:ferredoxin
MSARVKQGATALRLSVDPIACDGYGVCAELFHEWIRLDDWGYPIIDGDEIPPALVARARWTVSNCPALALSLSLSR